MQKDENEPTKCIECQLNGEFCHVTGAIHTKTHAAPPAIRSSSQGSKECKKITKRTHPPARIEYTLWQPAFGFQSWSVKTWWRSHFAARKDFPTLSLALRYNGRSQREQTME